MLYISIPSQYYYKYLIPIFKINYYIFAVERNSISEARKPDSIENEVWQHILKLIFLARFNSFYFHNLAIHEKYYPHKQYRFQYDKKLILRYPNTLIIHTSTSYQKPQDLPL